MCDYSRCRHGQTGETQGVRADTHHPTRSRSETFFIFAQSSFKRALPSSTATVHLSPVPRENTFESPGNSRTASNSVGTSFTSTRRSRGVGASPAGISLGITNDIVLKTRDSKLTSTHCFFDTNRLRDKCDKAMKLDLWAVLAPTTRLRGKCDRHVIYSEKLERHSGNSPGLQDANTAQAVAAKTLLGTHLPPVGLISMLTGVVMSIATPCVLFPKRYPAKVLNPSPDPSVTPSSTSDS